MHDYLIYVLVPLPPFFLAIILKQGCSNSQGVIASTRGHFKISGELGGLTQLLVFLNGTQEEAGMLLCYHMQDRVT